MFVHSQSRSLLLDAPMAVVDSILARMPATRVEMPKANVAVKHTEAATRLLRGMGLQAPSPIITYYNWPKFKGIHKPFDHQRYMAEFMTLHRRCFNLSEMGCYDADTEYLTRDGWHRIADYVGGEVGQYDPQTRQVSFVTPERFIKLPCAEMLRFKTTRGVDQLLSPEHRMLLADGSVRLAGDVAVDYGSQSVANRAVRFRTTYSVHRMPSMWSDEMIRLHVAASADGHFDEWGWVNVRLKRSRKIDRLRHLLAAAGFEHTDKPCQPEGFRRFRFKAFSAKGLSSAWQFDARQLAIVADEMVHWDGSPAKGSRGPSFTGTKADCDVIQHALASIGLRATLGQDMRSEDVWQVTSTLANEPGIVACNTDREPNVRVEPSPDGFKYCFTVPTGFLAMRRNGCIFMSGNSGKTNAALWAADYLMATGKVRKVLILSPLSTLERVWQMGVFDTLMHRKVAIVHGSMDKRRAALATDVDFYIVNHDGIAIPTLRDLLCKRPDIDLVIVDEGSKFRNSNTDKWKALHKIIATPEEKRLWWLTGTPAPNAPDDVWAQCKLVSPTRVPKFYGAFRREVCMEIQQHIWKARDGGFKKAFDAMQPAVRFTKAECLDLPPCTTVDWQCELTSDQRKLFKEMLKDMRAEVSEGVVVTAANAADKITKLRQILLGSVKLGDNYITIDASPRMKLLRDAIESAKNKAIVIVPYKGALRCIEAEVSTYTTVGSVNGDVPIAQRNAIFKAFTDAQDPKILNCHPTVMSHGLTLVEADVMIFFGPINSNDEYRQVVERINRPGQTRHMTIIRIGGSPVEWAIYRMLDTRDQGQSSILSLYNDIIAGRIEL